MSFRAGKHWEDRQVHSVRCDRGPEFLHSSPHGFAYQQAELVYSRTDRTRRTGEIGTPGLSKQRSVTHTYGLPSWKRENNIQSHGIKAAMSKKKVVIHRICTF